MTKPDPHDERYQVANADVQRRLRTIAGDIDEQLEEGWGFTLFLFNYGEGGAIFYLSSAERPAMVATIKEWLAKEEKAHGHANG